MFTRVSTWIGGFYRQRNFDGSLFDDERMIWIPWRKVRATVRGVRTNDVFTKKDPVANEDTGRTTPSRLTLTDSVRDW